MKKKLIFLGAGGFAKELYYWMLPHLPADTQVKGFLSASSTDLQGYDDFPAHLGSIDAYVPAAEDQFVLAIGDVKAKRKIVEIIRAKGGRFFTFVHPSCVVTPTVKIGEGSIICPLTLISNKAVLGEFVTINTNCAVGHDSRIGDFSVLSPMSGIMGGAQLETSVFLGANCVVGPRVTVGTNAKVSAGVTILKNLAADTLAAPTLPKILKWKR